MRHKNYLNLRLSYLLIAFFMFAAATAAQTTAFNYQGRLNNNAAPANGNYEMEFKLFDALAGGAQIGKTLTDESVAVINGIFATTLDFGAAAFDGGAARFLEIGVRQAGNPNPFTVLSPRQTISSAPYAIQARNALTADNSTNALQLGGIDASEYVTTATVGSSFIKNNTVQQTANFNINGNGFVGGNLGIGTTTPQSKLALQTGNGYGFTQTNGTVTVGSYLTGGSGWFGTRSNHPLVFFTNDSLPQVTLLPNGNLGIGLTPVARLDVNGDTVIRTTGSGGNMQLGTPNAETGLTIGGTNRADIRFDGSTLKLLVGAGTGIPSNLNGISVNTSGNVGIGTIAPNSRLTLSGGSQWTTGGWSAQMNMQNGGALGWEAGASGQLRGVSSANGNLYFFRTNSPVGTSGGASTIDLTITETGNLTQPLARNGVVKAMALVRVVRDCIGTACGTLTASFVNCYNSTTNVTSGNCGFSLPAVFGTGVDVDFGFQINNRFILLTAGVGFPTAGIATFVGTNRLTVANGNYATSEFYIFVF